jgi:hypothetical protein
MDSKFSIQNTDNEHDHYFEFFKETYWKKTFFTERGSNEEKGKAPNPPPPQKNGKNNSPDPLASLTIQNIVFNLTHRSVRR